MQGFTTEQRNRFAELIKEELANVPFVKNGKWRETDGEDVRQAQIKASKRFIVEGITAHPSDLITPERTIQGSDITITRPIKPERPADRIGGNLA